MIYIKTKTGNVYKFISFHERWDGYSYYLCEEKGGQKIEVPEAAVDFVYKTSKNSFSMKGGKNMIVETFLTKDFVNWGLSKKPTHKIRNVLVNQKKKLVTVVFEDGEHEIIECKKGDEFDINVGVALAIAKHLYGSKTKFHKDIESKTKVI